MGMLDVTIQFLKGHLCPKERRKICSSCPNFELAIKVLQEYEAEKELRRIAKDKGYKRIEIIEDNNDYEWYVHLKDKATVSVLYIFAVGETKHEAITKALEKLKGDKE